MFFESAALADCAYSKGVRSSFSFRFGGPLVLQATLSGRRPLHCKAHTHTHTRHKYLDRLRCFEEGYDYEESVVFPRPSTNPWLNLHCQAFLDLLHVLQVSRCHVAKHHCIRQRVLGNYSKLAGNSALHNAANVQH